VTAALVGPLPVVRFRGGPGRWDDPDPPKVAYSPPRDTTDPRFAECTDHRVACDCREALWAEDRQEWAYARREAQEAVDDLLAGHPTWSDDGNTFTGCMCTGCQLARALHLWPRPWAAASEAAMNP
jgi:hypothetical protein